MAKAKLTPIKAIRKKCLDCACGSHKEVRECKVVQCPLYPYRFGRRPTEAIVDTRNEFSQKNLEPSGGF